MNTNCFSFQTVFEIVAKPKSVDYKVMKEKRAYHKQNILNHHRKLEERESWIAECNLSLFKSLKLS